MNRAKHFLSITGISSVYLAMLMLIPVSAHSASTPGTLSQSPLFLSTASEPNVMFLLDDSGSMDWEVLKSPGAETAYPGYDDDYDVVLTPGDHRTRLELCLGYNVISYNPALTYTPWQGEDSGGNVFKNSWLYAGTDASPDFTKIRNNPYDTSSSTTDLTATGVIAYFPWTDADSDGDYDVGECGKNIGANTSDAIPFSKLSVDEQKNFANWYSYYRQREYIAKRAVSQVVAEASNVRMGLATLHDHNSVKTAISSMNSDPYSGNKEKLLANLNNIDSSSRTPLRSLYYNGARYLSCDTGNNLFTVNSSPGGSGCPALSTADGGACQQNFIVLMTDGYYNGTFTDIADEDGNNDTKWDGCRDSTPNSDGGHYCDDVDYSLGDIGMRYYEDDMFGTLDDKVPTTPGVDDADHQHIVTYGIAFGISGDLDPFGDDGDPNDANSDPGHTDFKWPTATNDNAADYSDPNRIDDLWHASYNSRGLFLDSKDPQSLSNSLTDVINNIGERTGSAAAVAFNSGRLDANSVLYLALFNSRFWTGQLFAYDLDGLTGAISSTANWEAGALLDSRSTSRAIITYDGAKGIPFQWDTSKLTAAQQNDLNTSPAGGTDALGEYRLDFIRGDRSNEGKGYNFRTRGSRLGDIIHSSPVYVGEPAMGWPDVAPFPTSDTDKYSTFVANTSRPAMIYAGANDGMLHGFNASDGSERFAYIPNALFSNGSNEGLHYLTDPAYIHRYYVDLSPTIADVFIDSGSGDAWHTVLLGGLRGGGRGYFALDITNPNNLTEGNAANVAMWEFTSSDDPDLGYTYSLPTIAMMANGEWAAIFGNGYNADGGDGQAKLFIAFLEDGLDGSWDSYVELSTGVGSITNGSCADASSDCNGLSTPAAVDMDGDGAVDRVYAGDTKGNMWAFDLSATNPKSWDLAYSDPLFTTASNQPITTLPIVTKHPSVADDTGNKTNNQPNTLVLFGTGQFLANGDKTTTDTQSFYGVWDRGDDDLERGDLVEQTFQSGYPSNLRVLSNNTIDWTQDYGWFIDLPDSGERVTTTPAIRGDLVYFNTLIPSSAVCDYGGSGWLMSVKLENGGTPDKTPFDLNNDGIVDASDMLDDGSGGKTGAAGEKYDGEIPTESSFLGDSQYTAGSGTDSGDDIGRRALEELAGTGVGRTGWLELMPE